MVLPRRVMHLVKLTAVAFQVFRQATIGAVVVASVTVPVAEFVAVVDSPGVRVHWDCGCVRLNGEDAVGLLERLAPVLAHYHVSVPFLKEPGEDGFPHRECAGLLRAAGYEGLVSLEMGRSARGLEGLRESAAKLVEWYA